MLGAQKLLRIFCVPLARDECLSACLRACACAFLLLFLEECGIVVFRYNFDVASLGIPRLGIPRSRM